MLASCNSEKVNSNPTYFPFKAKESDKWGFVDANGKVVYENLFDDIPTCVFNDMFYVNTDDGYELYSINDPTVKLGGPYLSVANFTGELAPCSNECENIKYIDKKGKVVFELPDNAVKAYGFENGFSHFMIKDDDNYIGKLVDKKGNIIEFDGYSVFCALSDGTFVASKDERVYAILNKEGKELCQFEEERFRNRRCLSDGMMYFISGSGPMLGADDEGVKRINGEVLFKNEYSRVGFTSDGNVILEKESQSDVDVKECFIKNCNGELLFYGSYDDIVNCRNGIVIAIKNRKFGAVDFSGNQIISFDYNTLSFVPGTDFMVGSKDIGSPILIFDENGIALHEYDKFAFVNLIRTHEIFLSLTPDINEMNWYVFPQKEGVETDCFDAVGLLRSFMHPDGYSFGNLLGFAGMTPGECAARLNKTYSASDIEDDNHRLPFEFFSRNDFGSIDVSLGFDEVVRTEYDWYGDPVNYSYSNAPCNFMIISQSLPYNSEMHINHIKKIDKTLDSVLEDEGFSKSYDSENDLVFYENDDVQLVCNLNSDELRMVVISK